MTRRRGESGVDVVRWLDLRILPCISTWQVPATSLYALSVVAPSGPEISRWQLSSHNYSLLRTSLIRRQQGSQGDSGHRRQAVGLISYIREKMQGAHLSGIHDAKYLLPKKAVMLAAVSTSQ